MADAALQRKNMVESQVRPSDVTDRRITAAMQKLEREAFVPEALKPLAYMDEALEITRGRAMLAPRTLAKLVQLAAIEEKDRVLVAGSLSGYTAALVSTFARTVVALESDGALSGKARETFARLGLTGVEAVNGPLEAGHAAKAPYDVILVEGLIEQVPPAWLEQLARDGRIVAIMPGPRGLGEATVVHKAGTGIAVNAAFEAAASILPGFARPRGFSF